jgi:hypothetical protein
MKDFSKVKLNQVVKSNAGNFYIVINRVESMDGKVAYFTGMRITNANTRLTEYEKSQYLTWSHRGNETSEENYSYTGNNVDKIIDLVHNQEVRIYGTDTIKIYLNYSQDFNGLFKVEDHSNDQKSIWLK